MGGGAGREMTQLAIRSRDSKICRAAAAPAPREESPREAGEGAALRHTPQYMASVESVRGAESSSCASQTPKQSSTCLSGKGPGQQ